MIFLRSSSHKFPVIYDALTRRAGKKTTLPTLVSVTGLDEDQIQKAIAYARKQNPAMAAQIEVVEVGRAWRFKATSSNAITHISPEEVVEAVEVGSPHIWKRVLSVLAQNSGMVLYKKRIAELANEDESQPALSEDQIVTAMTTILRQPVISLAVDVVWANRAWKYHDSNAPATSTTTPNSVTPSIKGSVLRYFNLKPHGTTLFAVDIANELGFTLKQVQNAVYGILQDDRLRDEFEVVVGSTAWRYRPEALTPALAQTSNGHMTATLEEKVPVVAYTPAAVTTTLPVTSTVPDIPQVEATPEPTPAPVATSTLGGRLFEEIGQAGDGSVLIREAESKLVYRAIELQ